MTINDAFLAMAAAMVADPALTRGDAGDIIEGFGPTMTGAEARQWIDAVAVAYESLGIINNGTYAALRNEIVNEGTTVALNLFDALLNRINALPESSPVNVAILTESNAQAKAAIPANIAALEGFKGVNDQRDAALDVAINALNELNFQL